MVIKTSHGQLKLPSFLPDATWGVVRGVDGKDLVSSKVEGLVACTYHLLGRETNLHKLMSWRKPIITDSGGFQIMSLIHDHQGRGKITDDEVRFKLAGLAEVILTPEKSIRSQFKLGGDLMICLDDCTRPDSSFKEQQLSVKRTVQWAKRCKKEFNKLSQGKTKPLLFAVVQGGRDKKLRKICAQELISLGFDGYCFGGLPVDKKGQLITEILEYTTQLLPANQVKFALGVGKPGDIVSCFKMGYNLFDCVIPTREARHKKLYIFKNRLSKLNLDENFYTTISLNRSVFKRNFKPVSDHCDCYTCQNFSLAYLYHLFKMGDTLAFRLATIHNLRFYTMLMEKLKKIKFKELTGDYHGQI